MKYIADFHIHSHYSRATSKALIPEQLDYIASLKGIKLIGTGDFTHPGWLAELKEKTEPDGNGLLKLKNACRLNSTFRGDETRFILTTEISNIYKRGGKVRKVHNVILVPGFKEAEEINRRLTNLGGNLTSDGRPILGLDSRDLLEIVLECSEENYFIPAHIWTPWFSMLGSKSGFDSPDECFADLSQHIHTIETGLSTDPPMNWLCSFLDDKTLVSNSDAHSPDKLGRNANIFDTGLNYYSLTEALKTGNPDHFHGTIDMFPQEGKYHYDGHRKCNICWNPAKTLKNQSICPVCKKPVTIGVMNRIIHLSDREDLSGRQNRLPFRSIIPLKEILSELLEVGVNSKKVGKEYMITLKKLGTELDILLYVPYEEIMSKTSELLAEAIKRMRNRQVIINEGYDGEYGEIKVFKHGELKSFEATPSLFILKKPSPPEKRAFIEFDLKNIQKLLDESKYKENLAAEKSQNYNITNSKNNTIYNLNNRQLEAVKNYNGPTLIIAGPGTGKTKTLTSKIAWLIESENVKPSEILAITFTNKAAGELRERLNSLLKKNIDPQQITVSTFHAFGLSVLKKYHDEFSRRNNFILADNELKTDIIKTIWPVNSSEAKKIASRISNFKRSFVITTEPKADNNLKSPDYQDYNRFEEKMQELNAFDLDDLIIKPLILFNANKNILNSFRQNFSYIFVDEYQDINDAQYRLLRLLAPDKDSNICVVGDPNQSIYSFRGANPGYIKQFTDDYAEAGVFKLNQSYRCSKTILNASSDILEGQSGLLEGIQEGLKISISEQPTDAAEGEFIAREIVNLAGGISFFSIDSEVSSGEKNDIINSLSDIAILCRTRSQFDIIVKSLHNHNIPVQQVGTTPFFRQEPFRTLINLLSIFSNEDSENSNFLSALKIKHLSAEIRNSISKEIKENDPAGCAESIKNHFFKKEEFDAQNWLRFVEIADGMDNLHDFLNFLSLGTGTDMYNGQLEAVSVMTLHASKGLEFECVFIAGCENGLLPYNLYKKEVDEEEEKRLLYVGMTRAKKIVFLTHARSRNFRGRKFSLPVSPFINSIKNELLSQIKNRPYKKAGGKDNQLSLFEF